MTALEKRPLGSTGLEVSCLGLGTVKIGRNQGVKYPAGFDLPDDRSVSALLEKAVELGINLIDTAPAYGSSEERLGKLLPDRNQWILCSKVGEEFVNGQSLFDFSAAHIRTSVERSLRRLRTDYLDIVLVHSDGNDMEIIHNGECLQELERLKEQGLIRSFGMSTKTVAGGLAAVQHADVVMVTYNPLSREDGTVIDVAAAAGKGVLIKKGLVSGHLDSLHSDQADPVAESLRFIFRKPGISSVIVGTINPRHLEHNANCVAAILSS